MILLSKVISLFAALVLSTATYCQDLKIFGHPTEKFEIGIPENWTHSVPKQGLALIAVSPNTAPRENFNIFLVAAGSPDLKSTYKNFVRSLSEAEGFKIIDEGEKMINGRNYKWLIEQHLNNLNGIEMSNYVFFTNNKGKALILTFVAATEKFESYKGLFDEIAITLKH